MASWPWCAALRKRSVGRFAARAAGSASLAPAEAASPESRARSPIATVTVAASTQPTTRTAKSEARRVRRTRRPRSGVESPHGGGGELLAHLAAGRDAEDAALGQLHVQHRGSEGAAECAPIGDAHRLAPVDATL